MESAAFPSRHKLALFFSKVERRGECWEWQGTLNPKGYGSFDGNTAHRAPYRWFVGPIPAGYQVDHLCRNRRCVNPAHGEAVTLQENRRRSELFRTHCKSGRHAKPHATHGYGKNKTCAECHNRRAKIYNQQQAWKRPARVKPTVDQWVAQVLREVGAA